MATSFAQHHPQHIGQNHFHYNQQRQTYSQPVFTPPSSVTPPSNNVSPSSDRQQKHCYLPAALRPTELPVKVRRPVTPPRSAHSSLDSQSSSQSTLGTQSLPLTPVEDFSAFIAPLGQVTRVVTDEWHPELGEVTGAPTRGHWKPDSSVTCCTTDTCRTVFSWLARRHHCRRCGGIFCTSHSARNIPLDQEARFHPEGGWVRSCDNCYNDFMIWQHDRKSRTSSITSGSTATPPASTFGGELPLRGSDFLGIKQNPQKSSPYGPGNESVGADWNWSTF